MAYVPTVWVDKVTKLGPTNLNHLEQGVQAAAAVADAAVPAPAGLVAGDLPVWNGAAWVKASSLTTQRLNVYGVTQPKITTSALSGGPPASPIDGDVWIATNVDTNGTRWQFQYNAGSTSPYKWEFVGGSKLAARVNTSEGTAVGGAWVDLATVGPLITIPRAGDYRVGCGCVVQEFGGAAGVAYSAVFQNNTVQHDPATTYQVLAGVGQQATLASEDTITGLAAADVLKLKYQASVGTNFNFFGRWIAATPIRIA